MSEQKLINPIKRLTPEERELAKRQRQAAIIKAEQEKTQREAEERQYVVLYYATDFESPNKEEIKSFEVVTGRKETYEFIKGMIDALDIHESKVLVGGVSYEKAASVYQFMKHVSQFFDDAFDIEDYNIGDAE